MVVNKLPNQKIIYSSLLGRHSLVTYIASRHVSYDEPDPLDYILVFDHNIAGIGRFEGGKVNSIWCTRTKYVRNSSVITESSNCLNTLIRLYSL